MSWGERWLLAETAFILLPAAAIATRLARWAPVRGDESLQPATSPRDLSSDERDRAHAAARMIRIAARHGPVRATCLERSVAMKWILARRGMEPLIRIGVARRDGRVEAHAWVECGGEVMNDDPAVGARFHPLPAAITAHGLRFS